MPSFVFAVTTKNLTFKMIELEKSCRTCLRQKQKHKDMKLLSSLWTDGMEDSSISLLEMLSDITIINKTILTDPMLLRICSSCELDLITAFRFKRVCRKTEQMLCEFDQRQIRSDIESANKSEPSNFSKDESAHDWIDGVNDDYPIDSNDSSTAEDHRTKRLATRAHPIVTYSDDNSSDSHIDSDEQDPTFVPPEENTKKAKKVQEDSGQPEMPRQKRQYIRRKPLKEKLAKSRTNLGKYCRRCDVKFDLRKLYLAHYKQVHMERMPCTFCGKLYYKQNIEKHMVSHSNEKNYVCSLCGSRFSYVYSI